MTMNRVKTAPGLVRRTLSLAGTAALAVACGSGSGGGPDPAPNTEPKQEGPFKSLEVAANGAAIFTEARAGVPFLDERVAFLATVSDDRGLVGLFMQEKDGTKLLYAGEKLVNGRDIDTSLEYDALLVADP